VTRILLSSRKASLLLATVIASPLFVQHSARADSVSDMASMERQIHALEVQLKGLKVQAARHEREVDDARRQARQARMEIESNPYAMRQGYIAGENSLSAPPGMGRAPTPYATVSGMPGTGTTNFGGVPFKKGTFQIGGITISLGGFVEMAGIYRSRNESADISSNFGAIPWKNAAGAHMNEFHETDRQSRFSILVQGDISDRLHVSGYSETDFQGAGSSSNSRQSNSYVLRQRLFYGEVEDKADEWYVAGGQQWSLATMFKHGMGERDENIPLVIDAQYIPGFTWTRNTGVRVVKGFNHGEYHIGLALENPQSVWSGTTYTPPGATSVTINSAGGQVNNPSTTYSDDVAPDIILKGTMDKSFGHFEALGMLRFLHDRVSYSGSGKSHVTVGAGGGGAMLIPIIKHKLDFQASGLVGQGIGRYGTSNLADATTNRFGAPVAMPEAQVLAGLVGHPFKSVDVYAYGGMEDLLRSASFDVSGKAYGYGNPNFSVAGCDTEGASTCGANIKRVAQGTVGFWWRYLQGKYGTLQAGAQYSYTNVEAFRGVGGQPHTDDNMVFLSLRYLPFQ